MIRRLFHLLFALCTVWAMILLWNWDFVTATEGVGPILVIGILPFGAVFTCYYIVGQYIDLF